MIANQPLEVLLRKGIYRLSFDISKFCILKYFSAFVKKEKMGKNEKITFLVCIVYSSDELRIWSGDGYGEHLVIILRLLPSDRRFGYLF